MRAVVAQVDRDRHQHSGVFASEQLSLHAAAMLCVTELVQSGRRWALPWQSIHEFFSVVTNPRIWKTPTPQARALEQIGLWIDSPAVTLLMEGPSYWITLHSLLSASGVVGPRVHDARIAAICIEHGVSELWSADRDFSKFAGLKIVNPLR